MPRGKSKPGVPGSGQGPGTPPDPNAPTLQAWADNKGEHGQVIVLLMEPATKGGMLPTNPFILSRTIKEAVGSIDSAYRDQAKNLVIKVRSEKKAKKLLQVTELIDKKTQVKVTEHTKLNRCRCIVTCHSVSELTDKELEEELEDQGVIGVHRFSKKGTKTNTMVVTVKGTVPPKEIAFGYEVCRTRPYKDSPMQCFRCFSFGHTKAKCSSEQEICRNCSEAHPITKDDGGKTVCEKPARCKNCGGNHSPAARTCPRYADEEAILDIRAKKDVSPREARRIYEEEKAAANHSYAAITKTNNLQQQQQIDQIKAKFQKELDETRKAMQSQFDEAKKAMQTELDLTKMALSLAKQEVFRLRAANDEDPYRKRKVSESDSRSDDSESTDSPTIDDPKIDEGKELLRHPDELPFVPQTRSDGTTVQPLAHVFADGHVIHYPNQPNEPTDNKETPNNTNNNKNKNPNKNAKKKRRSNSRNPKSGKRDEEATKEQQVMEQ